MLFFFFFLSEMVLQQYKIMKLSHKHTDIKLTVLHHPYIIVPCQPDICAYLTA